MRYRYLDDFPRGISVFAIFFTVLRYWVTQCPPPWMFWLPRSILLTSERVHLWHNRDLARVKINGKFHLSFCGLIFEQNSCKIKQSACILMIWTLTVKYAHIRDFAKQMQKSWKEKTIVCCVHCLVCRLQHIDELRRAFLANNGWSAFIESLQ